MGNYYETFEVPYALRDGDRFNPLTINAKGYERRDEEIKEDILDRFAALYGIDTSKIQVQVSQGVVHLSGQIEPERTAVFLAKIAGNTLGVKDVDSQIAFDRAGATVIDTEA